VILQPLTPVDELLEQIAKACSLLKDNLKESHPKAGLALLA
jgi:hypothetical protein